jgi:hypothetical protein
MKMEKCLFGILFVLAALVSCSKPESLEDQIVSDSNDVLLATAVELKGYIASVPADIKGIADTCKSKTFTLLAGKTTDVGSVVVANDKNFIYVTYNTTGGWNLAEVHLYVLDTEPTERLTPGQAPNKSGSLADGTTTYTFTIPLKEGECGSTLWLQAHASVVKNGQAGETAYGGEIVIPDRGSWYGNISYTVECCNPPVECKISASAVVTNVKCFGAKTGSIDLTVVNGTAPLTFAWSNGAATEDISELVAGTYSVTVTDAHQCVASVKDIIVMQPSAAITATSLVTDITIFGANDGAIDVTVNGGTPAYSYLWNNGAITQDLSNLGPGPYWVSITDANGCNTSLRELLVKEPDEEKPKGIVAFARKTYEPMVKCFLDYGFDTFGWTNGAMNPNETFLSTYELWINVAGCDISKAIKVGEIRLHYFAGTATATFTLLPGYTMSKSAMYMGNDMFPKIGGVNTIDPANYPYKHDLSGAATDSYVVNGLSGNIYVIGYILLNQASN